MSDLKNKDVEEDYIEQVFIELTDYFRHEIKFPSNFNVNDYNFFVKRRDSCGREEFLTMKFNKGKFILEQENLHDGDIIKILYKKK